MPDTHNYCIRCYRLGDKIGSKSHTYIENGFVVCNLALSQKCLACHEPAHQDRRCPIAYAFIEDIIKERRNKAIQKLNKHSDPYKIKIADWMRENTPQNKQIDPEWQTYLMKQVESK